MIGREEIEHQRRSNRPFKWCGENLTLHEIVLYSDKFQSKLVRLPNDEQLIIDSHIKDFLAHIRTERDKLWHQGNLPRNAVIECTWHKPMLKIFTRNTKRPRDEPQEPSLRK